MGWTSTHRPFGKKISEYFSEQFTWESETQTHRILASSLVRFSVWYAAMEIITKATGKREVIGVVVLVHNQPHSHYNISYKEMTEECGPCDADCPKRILDLLTPTENEYARKWRARCRENLGTRMPVKKKGHWMLLKRPLNFKDGTTHALLKIEDGARGHYVSNGRWYTLPNTTLKRVGYEVIDLDGTAEENLPTLLGKNKELDDEIARRLNSKEAA